MQPPLPVADEVATEVPAKEGERTGGRGGEDLERVMRQLRHVQETLARVERRGNAATLVMTDALSRMGERLRNMGVEPFWSKICPLARCELL